jgi:hypothetical protein
MKLLDENNFVENKNGYVNESQHSELKINIWFDLFLVFGIFVIAGIAHQFLVDLQWRTLLMGASGISLFWLILRSPALLKYYLYILPDVRGNHLGYAAGKLAYHKGYVLQADDMRLSLPGDKNEGLLAGNLYEVNYLPRAKMAISARVIQQVGEDQQAREFTVLFGQLLGFTETDIQANRNGELTFDQKLTLLKKSWWVILLVLAIVALALAQILPMLIDPAFLSDSIIFTVIVSGLMFFVIGVIFLSSQDAKNLLALFEGKIEQKEGIVQLAARTTGSGKSQTTHYYLGIGFDFELQIPQHTYEILIDGLFYHIFYTPRTKCLVSVEVLKLTR